MVGYKSRVLFKGTVKNHRVIFDYPSLWESRLSQLEGSRVQLTLDAEEKPKSISQLGYYYGGIIEATCLASTVFEGWTKDEVHEHLVSKLRSYAKELIYPDGHREIVICTEEIHNYDKESMTRYIDDVLRYLSVQHGLVPLNPEDYKYEKYHKTIDPQKEEKEW